MGACVGQIISGRESPANSPMNRGDTQLSYCLRRVAIGRRVAGRLIRSPRAKLVVPSALICLTSCFVVLIRQAAHGIEQDKTGHDVFY